MINTYDIKLKLKKNLDNLRIKVPLVAKQFENKLGSTKTQFLSLLFVKYLIVILVAKKISQRRFKKRPKINRIALSLPSRPPLRSVKGFTVCTIVHGLAFKSPKHRLLASF